MTVTEIGEAAVRSAVERCRETAWRTEQTKARVVEAQTAFDGTIEAFRRAQSAELHALSHLREVLLAGVPPAGDS